MDWLIYETLLLENKFLKMENQNKIADIVKKDLDFNKQHKSKQMKILTPKQMLQRLPVALAQVKAGKTSEHLLNEIHQIIYSFYQGK